MFYRHWASDLTVYYFSEKFVLFLVCTFVHFPYMSNRLKATQHQARRQEEHIIPGICSLPRPSSPPLPRPCVKCVSPCVGPVGRGDTLELPPTGCHLSYDMWRCRGWGAGVGQYSSFILLLCNQGLHQPAEPPYYQSWEPKACSALL